MKGISDIIAVLLMLIITIGLAGLAYSYISGVFTSRTSVRLSLDPDSSSCNDKNFTFYVRNDGTTNSGEVTITVFTPNGTTSALNGQCKIASVPAMSENSTVCPRAPGTPVGGYRVTINAPGAPQFTTTFYCGVPS